MSFLQKCLCCNLQKSLGCYQLNARICLYGCLYQFYASKYNYNIKNNNERKKYSFCHLFKLLNNFIGFLNKIFQTYIKCCVSISNFKKIIIYN